MKKFKVFCRDRGNQMYSCYCPDVTADSAEDVLKALGGPRDYFKAIPWPPDAQAEVWLRRYVGTPLTGQQKRESLEAARKQWREDHAGELRC